MKVAIYQLTPPAQGLRVQSVALNLALQEITVVWQEDDAGELEHAKGPLERTLEAAAALKRAELDELEGDSGSKYNPAAGAAARMQQGAGADKAAAPPVRKQPLPPHVQDVDRELERAGLAPSPIAATAAAPIALDPSDPNRPVDVDALRTGSDIPTRPENPIPAHGVEDIDSILGRQGIRPAPASTAPEQPAWEPPKPNPLDPNAPEDIDAMMGRKIVDLGVVAGVVDVDAALSGSGRPPQPHAEPAQIPAQPALPADSEITQAHVAAKLARNNTDCNCEVPAPVTPASGKKVPCTKCGKWTDNPAAETEASP